MVKKNVSGTSYDRVLPCGLTRGYKLTVVWRDGGLNACCLIIIGGGERSVGGRGECV